MQVVFIIYTFDFFRVFHGIRKSRILMLGINSLLSYVEVIGYLLMKNNVFHDMIFVGSYLAESFFVKIFRAHTMLNFELYVQTEKLQYF